MRVLLDIHNPEAKAAPDYVREQALAEGKKILKIVWDKEGGYPEHAWGHVQWSIRPYEQRYGCDGTTDLNIHLIALRLCAALGLDYPALYERAYEWDGTKPGRSWLRDLTSADWERIEAETVVPELSEQALQNLLYDLGDINNRSISDVLGDEFIKLGYNVENLWK